MSMSQSPPAWPPMPAAACPPAPAYPYGYEPSGIRVPPLAFPLAAAPQPEPESDSLTVLRGLLDKRRGEAKAIADTIAANERQVVNYEEMVAQHRDVIGQQTAAAEVVEASIARIIADIETLGGTAS